MLTGVLQNGRISIALGWCYLLRADVEPVFRRFDNGGRSCACYTAHMTLERYIPYRTDLVEFIACRRLNL